MVRWYMEHLVGCHVSGTNVCAAHERYYNVDGWVPTYVCDTLLTGSRIAIASTVLSSSMTIEENMSAGLGMLPVGKV